MSLSTNNRGSGTNTTAATSFTLAPASNLTANAMAVLCVAADNAGTNGAAMATFSVSDTKSNTWTRRQSPIYDPGAANEGVEGGIFTTPQDGGALTTSDTITVSFGSTTVEDKTWTLTEIVGSAGTPTYVTGGTGSAGGGSSGSLTTGTITSGDVVLAATFVETPFLGIVDYIEPDSDTTNGSWSTQQQTFTGTDGVMIGSQTKVTTATATQTYDVSFWG